MYKLNIEHQRLTDEATLIDNIARHICRYQIYGKAIIIAKEPDTFLIQLKTAWRNLKREMRDDIARTSNDGRKALLASQLIYMQRCTFAAKPPIEDSYESVRIATIDQILEWPPISQAMYITVPMASGELYRAAAWMPPYGLVVLYDKVKAL